MAIPIELLQELFDQALKIFLEREAGAIVRDVSERNLCGRLAIPLDGLAKEAGLEGYFADTEYNRKGTEVKVILDGEHRVVSISCDLILHSRGEKSTEDNLIAVEMKKVGRPLREKNLDRDRLRALTKATDSGDTWPYEGHAPDHVFGYRLGVYVEVDARKRIVQLEYFMNGNPAGGATQSF